ncbi:DUF1194 domain-containing protein [Bradyrhizobium japonicum]|uniref:DUF1194 domain-containing protein n=1 Tax=Bradyrhizobium japonicum TaxID=375 RepID=UPI000456B724|nr:DUF1194 domain-containing protein [Bradyrhizobium japonicum]AHY56204.1 hypothetical protein BJS_05737 [Bradyrhizobium japonicum SEMIA 5079]MCD9111951.1 DUF1194 domain-containing protein [Bradyrhizobium japonicum]MCD9260146.1 DUF1194 domain-containing protein [Bradyrhizobium japonicum SEMIA 5079]MCD9820683.1 DUF1194 domain-containing protein [Bradyrhizobium japonicum]MCD9895716.1 DUF1194 domain-containing protein [Bradyrhizobium japonicum]
MLHRISIAAALIAGAIAGGEVANTAALNSGYRVVAGSEQPSVDVELVLAVDVSYSMDPGELLLQREGYAEAIVSNEFLQAIKAGPNRRLALVYVEWSGPNDQKIIVPWRLIDSHESAAAVAAEIAKAPVRVGSRTSISGAINFALPLFDADPYRGLRRVIDVSGDGANNDGSPVTIARDAALARGITINGLPIMLEGRLPSQMDIDDLDLYYEDCVIGGAGSFMVTIRSRDGFKEAIRTKLVLEVAGGVPRDRIVSVTEREPRVSCLIGEAIWAKRSRW